MGEKVGRGGRDRGSWLREETIEIGGKRGGTKEGGRQSGGVGGGRREGGRVGEWWGGGGADKDMRRVVKPAEGDIRQREEQG